MNYTKINNLGGWIAFAIATLTYYFTLEDTMSLWDCSEYILSAYKLEVGHPPGAPLFMMLGRMFSFFVKPDQAAFMVNLMSALSSSFTILFMYWTISLLAKKMAFSVERILSKGQIVAIQSSALIGSLAYTFTETFWFSAVEGEVYAMASLFTAIIFWAALKWDEETLAIKHRELVPNASPTRWLLLIFFLLGLAIGVHLLGILALPALAYVIYFNKWDKTTVLGFFLVGIIGVVTLAFVQEGIIPGIVSWTSKMEIFFRNSLGLPFNVGVIFFLLLVIAGLIFGAYFTRLKGFSIMNTVFLSTIVLLIGYGSFAMIIIRSNADTPMNQNSPKNLVNLHSYLKREQYGSAPLLSGPYWNSKVVDGIDGSPKHQRRFAVWKNDEQMAAFIDKAEAEKFIKSKGGEIKEIYAITEDRKRVVPVYADGHSTFLPRMFNADEPRKIEGYKSWSGYAANGPNHTGKPDNPTTDGQRLPTFGENLTYMLSYQYDWMYFRYFMWNFAGRQNDIQGHGDVMQGNWKTGINFIDSERLGDQSIAPLFTTNNPSNNSFYLFPLILGLLGLMFHFYKAPKDAFVVLLLFIMTGAAIVIYLNQKTFEPRERDYAYAASFYAFALWIGLGVYALFYAYKSISKEILLRGLIIAAGACVVFILSDALKGQYANSMSMLYMTLVGGGAMLLMYALRDKLKSETTGAVMALALTAVVPANLALEGWDDHDRGNRTIGLDMAKNYLNSCSDGGIIFTIGDNDTFPLWYLQEVEGIKTSVRVYNLSLGQTDWYTNQMTMKVYDSEPVPISFSADDYAMGTGKLDAVSFASSYFDLKGNKVSEAKINEIFNVKIENNRDYFDRNLRAASQALAGQILNSKLAENNQSSVQRLMQPNDNPGLEEFKFFMELTLAVVQNAEQAGISQEAQQQIIKNMEDFEKSFDYVPIDYAIQFIKNQENIIKRDLRDGSSRELSFFPANGFIVPVKEGVDNMIKHGTILKQEVDKIEPVRFYVDEAYLTREQIMILDILNNSNWDRPIYFSSPTGTQIGKALYYSGYLATDGMVFKLTPIRGKQLEAEKMYENLMENFLWGNMNGKGVLNDYYSRRTAAYPYKNAFRTLADYYAREYLKGNQSSIDSLDVESNNQTSASAQEFKKRAVALCLRAFEIMPLMSVVDYGEVNSNMQPASPQLQAKGINYSFTYSHGNMHSFVRILFSLNEREDAEKYAAQVVEELESIMNFTMESKPRIAKETGEYFFSALDAYIEMYNFAESGNFNNRAEKYMSSLEKRFSALINSFKQEDLGKDRDKRQYERTIADFQMRWDALFAEYFQ